MAIGKIIGAQRDFSAGELDISVKRSDENPIMKTGARQMANLRILSSGICKNRPGRVPLFLETGRVEKITMAAGQIFYIAFGNGYLRIYNAAGTQKFTSTLKGDGSTAIPWTSATLGGITYTIIGLAIYIFYPDGAPNNVPQILTWDGTGQAGTWTLSTYAETITGGNQKRTLFYRISPQNITMQPSATTGSVTLTFSSSVLVAGMVGTYFQFCGRELKLTAVASGTSGTATVEESLPAGETLNVAATVPFNIGDVVIGSVTGAKGIVTAISAGTSITVQLLQATSSAASSGGQGGGSGTLTVGFTTSDTVVGPGGGSTISAVTVTTPQAVTVWLDEVMNAFRGYPSSCTYDQNRLVLCNFPSVPSGIAWSAIGLPLDLYVGAIATNAIFEVLPTKSQVLYAIGGMESSEFVFCDNAIIYIPINVQNPLVPGSVTLNQLAAFGCQPNVQPRRVEQTIIFMKAGGVEVGAVQAPGAYYRPYIVDHISEMHSHLFSTSAAVSIAAPAATAQFEEHYLYISLANGNVVVGKYQMRQGMIEPGQDGKPKVGWVPWTGAGTVTWVAALQDEVDFTASYAPNAVPAVSIVEKLDNTQYLDGALFVNALPAPFNPPGGKGPLYEFPGPNSTVFLIDLSGSSAATVFGRPMGIYNVDANGFIIAQNIDGENLSSASLVAGQPWTATLEPFVPDAQPGPSQHQRMFKRRVARMAIYVSSSSGFQMARLFSGPLTPTSPSLGTIMNFRRVDAYNQGDDPTQPPPLREEAERWRPLGRAYDPRVAVIKDLPGPLLIHEFGAEVTI